ncbi:MAG: NAD-dependent epimerase/dehydratase family protein [Acidimicrobiales bacterium]
MRTVVTGAAGFIGSTLTEALAARGDRVVAVDCFTPYYDPGMKRSNLAALSSSPRVDVVDADLRVCDVAPLLEGADVVFHLAAQPGVRQSWARGFADYSAHNILATQRLLEGAVSAGSPRLVLASSSSVYGNAADIPTHEDVVPRPRSPYGVTKLAAEHLSHAYAANWALPVVVLRYFTVYGPRQRPDMAVHRLFEAALGGPAFPLYGDGSAARDLTFVDDVVAATLAAADADVAPGTTANVAGGSSASVLELVELAGEAVGAPVPLERRPAQPGDVDRTLAVTELAHRLLGWEPRVRLGEGLAAQAAWHRDLRRVAA